MTEQVEDAPIDRGGYDFNAMQAKWRPVWEKLDPFRAKDDGSAERRYALTMFSYPSGDLHMGHAEVFALHDVLARTMLAASTGLPVWINRYGYLSDAKIEALASARQG